MSDSDIEFLEQLIKKGKEWTSENSIGMENLEFGLEYLFKMPDYDYSLIISILHKLKELQWDVSPQESLLDLLQKGIVNSRQQLNSSMQSGTPNFFVTLDRCIEAYRSYCHSWIYLDQLKQTVVIMAKNYIKTVSD